MEARLAERGTSERQGIVAWAAQQYGVDAGKVLQILKATCFSQGKGEDPASDAEVAALLVVAREHRLNPFLRQLFAFRDKKGGIVPVVSVDGFASIISEHPQCDGFDFTESSEMIDHKGKKVPAWIECTIYRKDRSHHTPVRERFAEVVRPTNAWDQTPSRMLRHRSFMQAGRIVLGLTVTDEEDAARIIDAGAGIPVPIDAGGDVRQGERLPASRTDALAADLAKKAAEAKPAENIDPATGEITRPVFPTTPDSVREGIEVMVSPEECQRALEQVMKLPANDERSAIMKAWNERVMALAARRDKHVQDGGTRLDDGVAPEAKATTAPAKPKGTKKIRDKIIEDLKKATTADSAGEIMAATTLYDWSDIEMAPVAAAYDTRLKELEA